MSTPHTPVRGEPIRKAVIPAAGLGTRLRPLTNAFPKELLPIGRRPVLAHIAAEMRSAGITDVLFIISHEKPQIRSYFGELYAETDSRLPPDCAPLRCSYAIQERQRGLGDALLCAEAWADGTPFVVAFGDCIIQSAQPGAPLTRMLETHRANGSAATVLAERVPRNRVSLYGVLAPEQGEAAAGAAFRVRDIVEKPAPSDAPSDLVVAARWILDPVLFRYLRAVPPDARGELNLTDAVRELIREGGAFWAQPLAAGERREDIGNFETFFSAFVRSALQDPDFGAAVRQAAAEEMERRSAGN